MVIEKAEIKKEGTTQRMDFVLTISSKFSKEKSRIIEKWYRERKL